MQFVGTQKDVRSCLTYRETGLAGHFNSDRRNPWPLNCSSDFVPEVGRLCASQAQEPTPRQFDVIIKGGTVYDGNDGGIETRGCRATQSAGETLEAFTRVELRYERKCSASLS